MTPVARSSWFLLLLGLLPACSRERIETSGGEDVVFDPPSIMVGEVVPGKKTRFAAVLRTSSLEDIAITKVVPSCGCTEPTLSGTSLNANGPIRMTIDYHAPPSAGPFAHEIAFVTSAGTFRYKISGRATWPIVEDRGVVRVENRRGEKRGSISLLSPRDTPFTVLSAHASSDLIKPQLSSSTKSSVHYEITLLAELPENGNYGLTFQTDNLERPVIRVPIVLYTKNDNRVTPSSFFIRMIDGVTQYRIEFTIKSLASTVERISFEDSSQPKPLELKDFSLTKGKDGDVTVLCQLPVSTKVTRASKRNVRVSYGDGSSTQLNVLLLP